MNQLKKIIIYILFIVISSGFLFLQSVDSRGLSEDEQMLWVGIGAFKDGFYDIAEKQFSNFIKTYPKHDKIYDIHYLLGRILLSRGRLKEAKTAFLKIITNHKQFENMDYTLLGMAEIEIKLGNREEALRFLLSITKRFPKFSQIDYSYYLIGLLEIGSNRLTEAESTFRKVLQNSRNNNLLHSSTFWLGVLSFKQNQYEEAAGYFQPLWENPKTIPPEYLKYILFWLGESKLKSGKFNEAKLLFETFEGRFKNDPLLFEATWRKGFCDYQSGNFKNATDTFLAFKNQFKDSPLLLYTHYLLGKIFMVNGDHLSSIKELNLILNSSEDNLWGGASLLALYWNYLQLGEPDGVNRTFQRVQKLNHFEEEKVFIQWINAEIYFAGGEISDSLPYYFNILNTKFREKALIQIGKGYFFENKFREAITNLDILILEFPNSPYLEESYFIKGECLVQLGNIAPALETYELALRQKKNDIWHLFTLMQTGSLYVFQNEFDRAEMAYQEVMEAFPNHPLFYHAALQLGNLNFYKKNIVEAVHYYSIVLKGNTLELFGQAYFALGEIFYQQGKYERALNSFETAIQYLKETSSWFFLTHLEIGNLKRRVGKYEEAKKSYLTIIDQSKDEEMKKAATELLRGMETH